MLLAVCGAASADCHSDCHSEQCSDGCTHAIVHAACAVGIASAEQAGVCHGAFFILDSTPGDVFEPPRFAA